MATRTTRRNSCHQKPINTNIMNMHENSPQEKAQKYLGDYQPIRQRFAIALTHKWVWPVRLNVNNNKTKDQRQVKQDTI